MKFAIITHSPHKILGEHIYAYEPYIREMNLWLKNVSETRIIAPVSIEKLRSIDSSYQGGNIELKKIPRIKFTSFSNALVSLFKIPVIFLKIVKQCYWADHIHLRCPGNIGLIGSFVQIFFLKKRKR